MEDKWQFQISGGGGIYFGGYWKRFFRNASRSWKRSDNCVSKLSSELNHCSKTTFQKHVLKSFDHYLNKIKNDIEFITCYPQKCHKCSKLVRSSDIALTVLLFVSGQRSSWYKLLYTKYGEQIAKLCNRIKSRGTVFHHSYLTLILPPVFNR